MGLFDAVVTIACGGLGAVVGSVIPGVGTAAGLTAGLALGGTVSAAHSSENNSKTSLKAVKENNASQMQLLEKQQQFAVDQQNAQNEYNSPAEQMKRLQLAGINPAFSEGVGLTAGNQPIAVSPPSTPSLQSGTDALSAAAQASLADAQVQNLAAQTVQAFAEARKIDSETKTNTSLLDLKKQLMKGEVSINGQNFKILVEDENLRKWQAKEIQSNINALEGSANWYYQQVQESLQQIELLKANTKSINEQTIGQQIDNVYKSRQWDESIKLLMEQAKCTRAQASSFLAAAAVGFANAAGIELNNDIVRESKDSLIQFNFAQTAGQQLQNGLNALQFKVFKKYGDLEKWLDIVNNGSQPITSMFGTVSQFLIKRGTPFVSGIKSPVLPH